MCKFSGAVFTAGFLFVFSPSYGQMPNYEIGLSGGAYVYQGDLAPSRFGSFKTVKPGISASFAKPLLPILSVSAQLTYSGLRGNDSLYAHVQEYRGNRNFAFNGKVRELLVMANYFPLRLDNTVRFEPYVSAGIGFNFKKVNRDYSAFIAEYFDPVENLEARLAMDQAVNPNKPHVVLPVGVGVRYHLSQRWAIGTGITYRFTLTDFLDGFSNAANPDQKDHYYGIHLGVIYKRNNKGSTLGCPVDVL